MKLLLEINEKLLGVGGSERLGKEYRLRKSARALVFNENGEIAIQHSPKYHFHKLPGGGVEHGESVTQALRREILEEVGCEIEIIKEVGMTIEYRNANNLLHISYCYVAQQSGKLGKISLEAGEIEEEQVTLWLAPGVALEKMKLDEPKKKVGLFMVKREIAFLEEYLKIKAS